MIAAPETLARRRGICRLCRKPIIVCTHYVTKLDHVGWVHAKCGAGYRRVQDEHAEEQS